MQEDFQPCLSQVKVGSNFFQTSKIILLIKPTQTLCLESQPFIEKMILYRRKP